MADDDRERVIETLQKSLRERDEVLEAYLFGSLARGDEQPHSDVDVAVYVDLARLPESTFGYAAELTADLMGALKKDSVDVVILNQAPPLLYHRVLRDGLRLTTRNCAATTTREGRALSRYCDYVPQLRKIEAAHSARVSRGEFGR